MKMLRKFTIEQKALMLRILEISHEARTSHLGSCLTAVDIINAIYKVKKKKEKFVLSNGHAGVALYVVLEKYGLIKNPNLKELHVHPDRNKKLNIDASTGSLGQGLSIAVGLALANRRKNVYCSLSDGECAEGAIWEALRIASEQKLSNLKVIINANGWAAYDPISVPLLIKRLSGFINKINIVNGYDIKQLEKSLRKPSGNYPLVLVAITTVEILPFLKGQDAHYYVMTDEDFILAKELLGE